MDFNRSTTVITGASRGIGREIALAFARKKTHPLILLARDQQALQRVCEECLTIGVVHAEYRAMDLSNPDEIDSFIWPADLPDPGVLVNNAGIFLLKSLEETTPDEFQHQWMVNTYAPFLLTRKLLPRMEKTERGLIVNISSMAALSGQERSGAYTSSKHALLGYTRSLRRELYKSKIAVTALNLGQTMSSSWEGVEVNPQELINPADIAELIVQLTRFSVRTVAEEILLRPQAGDRSPN